MMNNFGFNPYFQQPQQRFVNPLKIYSVSNIMEANATPVESLEPIFFYNKAENVIYKKQIDSTGAAPIETFRVDLSHVNEEKGINTYEDKFNAINERLDTLEKTLNSSKGKLNSATVTVND